MTFPYPYSGPVALYNNVPINTSYYKPKAYFIDDITLGSTTIVTTDEDHDYEIGQLVRLIIPSQNGTYQLNEQTGYVIEIPSDTTVTLDIDSSSYTLFQTSTYRVQPQILAIGDINQGQINSLGTLTANTYIPGRFRNISPN